MLPKINDICIHITFISITSFTRMYLLLNIIPKERVGEDRIYTSEREHDRRIAEELKKPRISEMMNDGAILELLGAFLFILFYFWAGEK